jgi:iron complex transport system substrate-binding protein
MPNLWISTCCLLLLLAPIKKGAPAATTAVAADTPASTRILSVNQCVDQMLAYLAPQQLVSVTWLSHAPADLSVQPLLAGIPANHAQIEEVLRFRPDLVIGGEYGAPSLQALLPLFNLELRQVPLPESFPALYANWRQLGEWTRSQAKAARITGNLEAELGKVHDELAPLKVKALIINPNGWIAGAGNFQDAFMARIGLHNLALDKGLQGWGDVDLEALVQWAPDLIIVPQSHYAGLARATLWMEHPALTRISRRYPLLTVDAEQLSCGTPELLHVAARIRDHLRAKPATLGHPDETAASGP